MMVRWFLQSAQFFFTTSGTLFGNSSNLSSGKYESAKPKVPADSQTGRVAKAVQKAKTQVMFKKAMEVVDAWILSAPGTPETANFSQKSVGDSFGKPSASLVKQHICREIPAETSPLLPLIQKMMTLWQCFVQIMPNAKGPLYKSNQN